MQRFITDFLLWVNMGTSLQVLEQHYSHVVPKIVADKLLVNRDIDKNNEVILEDNGDRK